MTKILILLLTFISSYCIAAPVFPEKAESLKAFEMGEFVKMFMPLKGSNSEQTNSWDFNADNPDIIWLTDGVESRLDYEDKEYFAREGMARIHIQEKYPIVLKKRNTELAWTVEYRSKNLPKFGVESVEIWSECFGSMYNNCSLSPMAAIKAANISAIKVCSDMTSIGSNEIIGYKLQSLGREDIYFSVMDSSGSGGSSKSYTIRFQSKNLCSI